MNRKLLLTISVLAVITLVVLTAMFLANLKSAPHNPPSPLPIPTPFQSDKQQGKKDIGAPGPNPTEYYTYEESVRKTRPDIYLSNRVPHEDQTFAISKIVNWNTGSRLFIVSLKGTNAQQSKGDAINWMKSLRLTNQQIESLSISYQPEVVVKLKDRLPHDGLYHSINYDPAQDKITVIIDEKTRAQGGKELDTFLEANGIIDRSFINNLTILYR